MSVDTRKDGPSARHESLRSGRQRSWLFTTARPDRLESAAKSGADVVVIDLEDTVPPEEKAASREAVRALLAGPLPPAPPLLAIRINSPATRFGLDDLAVLLDTAVAPDFVVLPKIEASAQVEQIEALLEGAGKTSALVPMIESARGVSAAEAIASAGKRIWGLMFGAGDYAADTGAQRGSMASKLARCRIAAAAAAARVQAIDAPCFARDDTALLEDEIAFARANGLRAKATLHPTHVGAINAGFVPSTGRADWAKEVLAASAQGAGAAGEATVREPRETIVDASPPEPASRPPKAR